MPPLTSNTHTLMHSVKLHKLPSRRTAGRNLAQRLTKFSGQCDVVVLALPNGGVEVGAEIAVFLKVPFDVLLVRKITTSGPEHAVLGAITSGGVRILNGALIDHLHLSDLEIRAAVLQESMELCRSERLYRGEAPSVDVADQTVILVDDGGTPCSIIRDAIRLLRRQHAERIIFATPATCHHAACHLRHEADEVVTLREPSKPVSVGKWLKHVPKTTDEKVCRLMMETHAC
ncbi:MAG: phosphoribosyltransferase family protein [Verrucomicrobiota bacterium]